MKISYIFILNLFIYQYQAVKDETIQNSTRQKPSQPVCARGAKSEGSSRNEGGASRTKTSKPRMRNPIDFKEAFPEEMLTAHNNFRVLHQAKNLTLDCDLIKEAQTYAYKLATAKDRESRRNLTRQFGDGVSVLIFHGDIDVSAELAVEHWYNEVNDYPFEGEPTGKVLKKVRHFTQLVWKSTEKVGCAQSRRSQRLVFVCCYWMVGNIPGQFEEEVLPQSEAKFLSNNKQFDERYDDYQTGPPNKQQPQQQQQQQGGGKNPSSYATSSQGTGQGSKPSPPTSTSPTYAGPTPPTSTSPTPSGPTPPTSTSPTPSGPTPPTSTSTGSPTPPTSTSPTPSGPTPPTSTSPTPSGPTPPTSTSPTPSGPTPPTSTSPGTGGTGPTNIGWHGTGYGGSPWALMYNPYRTTPTAYSVSPQDSFAVQVLMAHNYYRSMHGVQPLLLDPNMNQYAQQWANHLAMVGSLDHRPNNPYGENLYKGWSTNPNFQMNGARPVNAWYSEIVYYEYGTEPINNFAAVGHSTQVLWASSQRLGVGQAKQGNTIFVVCNYDPAGNQFGYFAQNVVQPGVGFRMTRPYGNDMLTAYGLPAGQRRRNYAFNQLMLPSGLSTAGAGGGMGAGLNGNMGLNPNLAMNNGAGLNGNMGMNPNLALNSNMGLNSGQVPNMQQYPPAAPGAGGGLGAGANAGINGLGMNANLNLGSRGGAGGGAGLPPAPPGPQGAPGGLSIGANANTNLLPLGGQTLISVG